MTLDMPIAGMVTVNESVTDRFKASLVASELVSVNVGTSVAIV